MWAGFMHSLCIAHVRTNNDATSLASRHTICGEYSHSEWDSVGYSVSSNALYGRLSMCVHVCTVWIYQNCIVLVGHVDNNMYAMQMFFVRTVKLEDSVECSHFWWVYGVFRPGGEGGGIVARERNLWDQLDLVNFGVLIPNIEGIRATSGFFCLISTFKG